jgi:hypothetical protein
MAVTFLEELLLDLVYGLPQYLDQRTVVVTH